MSGFFEKVDVWQRFGRLTNSKVGLAFQDRFRPTVERMMLPMAERQEGDIPLVRLEKPLWEARVALVTTTGVFVEGQRPFDTAAQLGDPTFRLIPSDVDISRLRIAHTHYTHERALEDINVIFPVERLRALAWEGAIGSLAPSFFSYGFDLHVEELVGPGGSAREMAGLMVEEGVDAALFTPG
jgi:D-proline reductase (dithiol) PrdB